MGDDEGRITLFWQLSLIITTRVRQSTARTGAAGTCGSRAAAQNPQITVNGAGWWTRQGLNL
jgi:hypothetical protein